MRIAVCSREPIFGEALTSLLSHEGNFDVVNTSVSIREVVATSKQKDIQVILVNCVGLLDNELEFLMGARAFGGFGVVLLLSDPEPFTSIGADAICLRSAGTPQLLRAITEAGSAFVRLPSGRVREARARKGGELELSKREFEVASLVAKGYQNRKISLIVGLKEQSIKNLVCVIMRKLKCENRTQLALRLTSARIEDVDSPQ